MHAGSKTARRPRLWALRAGCPPPSPPVLSVEEGTDALWAHAGAAGEGWRGECGPSLGRACRRCHSGSQSGVRNEDGLEEHTQDEGKALEAEAVVQKRWPGRSFGGEGTSRAKASQWESLALSGAARSPGLELGGRGQ